MWWCLLLPIWSAACGRPTAAAPKADALVLELGGEQGSLRQALVAAGIAPAPHATAEDAAPPDEPDAAPEVGAQPEPVPIAVEPPAVTPDHIEVELGRGETLIHLAKKHLGNGNRFREILTANGWTEQDARRLPAGQRVKIPLDQPVSPTAR